MSPLDLSAHSGLRSDVMDDPAYASTPEQMGRMLAYEADRLPMEMTYSHVSAEEVDRYFWSGVVRDWHKVQYAMDRETQEMQRNN
jgi:hypothetical protein